MNKQKFIELVENPSNIRDKDADILAELARNYPYASLVRTMLAKSNQHTPEAKSSLATAALYIPDRRVLKAVMEDSLIKAEAIKVQPDKPVAPQALNPTIPTPPPVETAVKIPVQENTAEVVPQAGSVFDELEENLRKLREQRERFNQDYSEEVAQSPTTDETQSIALTTATEEDKVDDAAGPVKSKLPERLQEIVETKEEQEINDPKRKEQINLIDNFIRNSSTIARKYRALNDEQPQQSDLTSGYNFTPQDLATENLAQIMVRQGKTEKAIDIYEKLVLKYPQKRAYFASCIEKLKNSL